MVHAAQCRMDQITMMSDVSKSNMFSALFFKKSFAFEFVSVFVYDSDLIYHFQIISLIVNEKHPPSLNQRLKKTIDTIEIKYCRILAVCWHSDCQILRDFWGQADLLRSRTLAGIPVKTPMGQFFIFQSLDQQQLGC